MTTPRLTRICATIGPASRSPERLVELVRAGIDIARLNFSHGDVEQHAETVRRIRAASKRVGRPVAICQDLQGPRIRIGSLPENVRLAAGDRVHLRTGKRGGAAPTRARSLPVTYAGLAREVKSGARILLKDGTIELRVRSVRADGLLAEVVRGGEVHAGCGLNAPDSTLDVPALTRRDREHLKAGVRMGVDAVALSFVRDASDVTRARRLLAKEGSDALLIAKIERRAAIDALDGILAAADGVIVARGDLGVECPLERVPILQKGIIRDSVRHDAFCLTATQMLESMIRSPSPTRAEVSDVANAILDGSDAVMLSGETAVGDHPVEAVRTMARIARMVEAEGPPPAAPIAAPRSKDDFVPALARAAVELAAKAEASALVAVTESGHTAALLSAERPGRPVYALVGDAAVARRLLFRRGVEPRVLRFGADDDAFTRALETLRKEGALKRRDVVVLVGGTTAAQGAMNALRVVRV